MVGSMQIRCFFFFSSRRRHTRCYRDWSSDVCSSDLGSSDPRCRPAACSQICSPTAEKPGAAWVSRRTICPILDSAAALWARLAQGRPSLDRLQNGCSAWIKFLVEGGFDSHAPPPSPIRTQNQDERSMHADCRPVEAATSHVG